MSVCDEDGNFVVDDSTSVSPTTSGGSEDACGSAQAQLARELLELLNSASLKQLRALHLIGQKRAELIIQRRMAQPFATVCMRICRTGVWIISFPDDAKTDMHIVLFWLIFWNDQLSELQSVGMSDKMIENFFDKNTMNRLPIAASNSPPSAAAAPSPVMMEMVA
jgi:hypothetical protein